MSDPRMGQVLPEDGRWVTEAEREQQAQHLQYLDRKIESLEAENRRLREALASMHSGFVRMAREIEDAARGPR